MKPKNKITSLNDAKKVLKHKNLDELMEFALKESKHLNVDVKDSIISKKFLLESTGLPDGITKIVAINKALSFAKTDQDAARAYDERSKVCINAKCYERAIVNIHLALANNHSDTKQLNEREELCQKYLEELNKQTDEDEESNIDLTDGSDEDEDELKKEKEPAIDSESEGSKCESDEDFSSYIDGREDFELSYEANPKIPWIVNCLELKEDDINGKHIITKIDLNVGDVIVVEKPLFSNRFFKSLMSRCSFCLNFASLTLIPCSYCTTG